MGVVCALACMGIGWAQTQYIYVDASRGNDSNSGTSAAPLKSIRKAASVAEVNLPKMVPTTVIINPGTYRESIEMDYAGLEESPAVVFQAAQNGTVVISGAEVWTGWRPHTPNPAIFTHTWPYRWGLCRIPDGEGWGDLLKGKDMARRREMIFVSGVLLKQVDSLGQLSPAAFYIDERQGTAYIWPPSNVDMGTATVEVSVREQLFKAAAPQNLTLQGLTFQYANTCIADAAVELASVSSFNGKNLVVEDSTFQWNNWGGLAINTAYGVTVRRVVARNNGGAGMYGYAIKDAVYDNDEGSYNNWRGALGGFLGWDPAGGKFFSIHGGVFKQFRAIGNQARGLWFDTDNANVVIDGALLAENKVDGLFVEANQGPIVVKDSKICGNAAAAEEDGGGIVTANSEDVSLSRNIVYNNTGAQVLISGDPSEEGFTVKDWETGKEFNLFVQRWKLEDNTIVGVGSTQLLVNTTLPDEVWQKFARTLFSSRNTWYNAAGGAMFRVPQSILDLAGWRSSTGQDVSSAFSAPQADIGGLCSSTARLVISSTALAFRSERAGENPPAQVLAISSSGAALNFTATAIAEGGNWLAVAPAGGVTPLSLNVKVDTRGLGPGTYSGSIIVTAANIQQVVPVSLVVGGGQRWYVSTNALAFQFQLDSPLPPPQILAVTAAGGDLAFTVSTRTTSGGNWLSVSPPNGISPATLTVAVNPVDLDVGTYAGTITIAAAAGSDTPQVVNVVLSVGAVAPPLITSLRSAASFLGESVAPGQMVVIYGSALGPPELASLRLNLLGLVDTNLAGTKVWFDGIPAPLIHVWSTQVSAVVPYAIAGRAVTHVTIERRGVKSNNLDLPVAETAPGIFTADTSGRGPGAILNEDLTLNSPLNAARTGSIVVIYATGEGQTIPGGTDGKIAGSILPTPVASVSVRIGGKPADVLYAGAAPTLVAGVLQVNARIPDDVTAGPAVPVVLTIGNNDSQPDVTLAVQ